MQPRAAVDEIEKTANNINRMAKSNNNYSKIRKEIVNEAMDTLSRLFNDNAVLKGDFEKMFANVELIGSDVISGIETIQSDNVNFEEAIEKIAAIKEIFQNMNEEINALTKIVDTIKNDTDEIFSLALNASIVSSKYTHTSGVFDIIANKLNEMSNFIGENLKSIIDVVVPITEGLVQLIEGNSEIIEKTNSGYKNLNIFTESLEEKREVAKMVVSLKTDIDNEMNNQFQMLTDLKKQLTQMNYDSDEAIKGSGNNIGWAEQLTIYSIEAKNILHNKAKEADNISKFKKKLSDIKEIAHSIFLAASTVHNKSKTQLEFSKTSADFCDNIIEEANIIVQKVNDIETNGKDFNEAMNQVTNDMKENVSTQIQDIIRMFENDQSMMDKFNYDYSEIDNIIGFLRNIMKSMNLIGMLSRIESSREPEEYVQFMTISENIRALQAQIHDNIPAIEENVERTRISINTIRDYFEEIFLNFSSIDQAAVSINNTLLDSIKISSNTLTVLSEIADRTKAMSTDLLSIRNSVNQMLENISHPIEGGAFNRDNANRIETMCNDLLNEAVL